jgi:hypothetical protein
MKNLGDGDPCARAFVDCELFALVDLFDKYALSLDRINNKYINHERIAPGSE